MTTNPELGIFYALLSGLTWGIGPLLLKRGLRTSNVSTATLIEQHVSVGTLVLIAALRGELVLATLSLKAFLAFAAAGMVGASFGKIFYYKGIDKVGASKSISLKNSSPILTTFLAVIILGEQLTFPIAIGVVLIVFGIFVFTRLESKGEGRRGQVQYLLYPFLAAVCFGINPIFKKMGVDAAHLPTLGALITQSTGLMMMLTAGRFLDIKPSWERVPIQSLVYFSLAGMSEAVGSLFTFFALLHAPVTGCDYAGFEKVSRTPVAILTIRGSPVCSPMTLACCSRPVAVSTSPRRA